MIDKIVAVENPLHISKELLKTWYACSDGYRWFLKKFPQGADYGEVGCALRADKRYSDAGWLTNQMFSALLEKPELIGKLAEAEVMNALVDTKESPNSASGYSSTAASSGDYSKAASSGDYSTAASSGDYSKAASSGYSSTAASSGYSSTAASSGDYSKAASSGDYSTAASSGVSSTAASSGVSSKAASSGDYSKAVAEGENTIAMVAGIAGKAKAGENGCIALPWFDKSASRNRIAVGYVGENIKANTFYKVAAGEFIEVAS